MFLTPAVPRPQGTSGRVHRCSKCDQNRPIEGGIERRPGRWECAACWRKVAAAPKRKK